MKLTKREHFALEITKALIMSPCPRIQDGLVAYASGQGIVIYKAAVIIGRVYSESLLIELEKYKT